MSITNLIQGIQGRTSSKPGYLLIRHTVIPLNFYFFPIFFMDGDIHGFFRRQILQPMDRELILLFYLIVVAGIGKGHGQTRSLPMPPAHPRSGLGLAVAGSV